MIKQLIASILIVAVFNPFCCCFNLSLLASDLSPETAEVVKESFCSSCSLPDNHKDAPPTDDTPCCPEDCGCSKLYTTEIQANLKQENLEKDTIPALLSKDFTFREHSIHRVCLNPAVIWKPPAWNTLRAHILFCSPLT